MEAVLKQMHEDILSLRNEVKELKECFHEDFLILAPEVVKAVREARERMKKEFISHESMAKEFFEK